jgi:hypothetical protein
MATVRISAVAPQTLSSLSDYDQPRLPPTASSSSNAVSDMHQQFRAIASAKLCSTSTAQLITTATSRRPRTPPKRSKFSRIPKLPSDFARSAGGCVMYTSIHLDFLFLSQLLFITSPLRYASFTSFILTFILSHQFQPKPYISLALASTD